MRTDVSGWVTRLTDEDIDRYTRSGAWRDVTLADCALREAARGAGSDRGRRRRTLDHLRSRSWPKRAGWSARSTRWGSSRAT